ncbi:hypothetical protein [Roseinatronobacter sp.]
MRHLVRLILVLAVLAGLAVVAYAYFGDMSAEQRGFETPVTLDVN